MAVGLAGRALLERPRPQDDSSSSGFHPRARPKGKVRGHGRREPRAHERSPPRAQRVYTIWRASQTSFLTRLAAPTQLLRPTSNAIPDEMCCTPPGHACESSIPFMVSSSPRYIAEDSSRHRGRSATISWLRASRGVRKGTDHPAWGATRHCCRGIAGAPAHRGVRTARTTPPRGATRHCCRGNAGARAQPRRPHQRTILTRTRRGRREALPRRRKFPV
jgi:hypothetical protein